jgi:membrane protein
MISSIFSKIKDRIRNYPSDILSWLEYWIPIAMIAIPFLSGLVGYIKFLFKGGYNFILNGHNVFSNWTEWPFEKIFSSIVGKIVLVLIFAEFIIVMIHYFKNSNKFKKIAMIVVYAIFGIQFVLTVTIFDNILTEYLVTQYIGRDMISLVENIPIDPVLAIKTYLIITIGSFLFFLVLIFITKECRRVIGEFVLGIAITYLVVPLIFWVLYNIIQLLFTAISLVILVIVIRIFSSGSSGGGSRMEIYDSATGEHKGGFDI